MAPLWTNPVVHREVSPIVLVIDSSDRLTDNKHPENLMPSELFHTVSLFAVFLGHKKL